MVQDYGPYLSMMMQKGMKKVAKGMYQLSFNRSSQNLNKNSTYIPLSGILL